MINLQAHTYHE